MRKLFLIALFAIFTIGLFGQTNGTGTGWDANRKKTNFKDSTFFSKSPIFSKGIINTLKGLAADKIDSTKVSGTTATTYQGATILSPAFNPADVVTGVALADTASSDGVTHPAGSYATAQDLFDNIDNDLEEKLNLLGADIILPMFSESGFSSQSALTENYAYWSLFYVRKTQLVTGAAFLSKVAGNYTGDQYNGIALYSYSGTTSTQIAKSYNNEDRWKVTAETIDTVKFSQAVTLTPGFYKLAFVYNNSAQVTAPSLYYSISFGTTFSRLILGNSKMISGIVTGMNDLPASEVDTDMNGNSLHWAIWLY